ncbi:MAG: hypothetical protein H0W72_01585 [Planctomycetes bacterium]|nr:hypothetical protein [Planctomycetota bacterium]
MTLIELMIAIPLSLAVIGAAAAAFTVTAKTVAQCERLSRKNQMVREAYLSAADEADFWWSVDDPFDPARQPQRNISGSTGDGGAGNPMVPIDLPDAYWNWDIADPRTWQRNGCWRANQNGLDFSIISRMDDPDPNMAWSHQVFDRIFNSLGMYGVAEYEPPTAYWWYLNGSGGTNSFGNAMGTPWPLRYGSFPSKLRDSMYSPFEGPDYAGGRQTGTHHRLIGVAPRLGWSAGTTDRSSEISGGQLRYPLWSGARVLDYAACSPEMKLRPAGWPIARGGVLRVENQAGRATQLTTQIIDDESGERQNYLFLFTATSLRGARQQRDWPHWNPPAVRIDR